MASGICPSKCVCNDKQLKASCEYSNLEVVPIQLNPDIKTLKLNNNKIQSVHLTFIFYTNLMDLDLSVNKIKNLGSKNFEFQMNLIKLNVSRNSIKNLHRDCFKGLEKLAILDLSDNLIEEINDKLYFKHLRNLKELNLSKNNIYLIETGAFDHVENLKRLVLSGNQLMKIPDDAMHSLKNLVELDLNNNLIRDVHFSKNLTNLEIIKIRSNLLGDVGNDSFTNVPRLKKLDLSDNNLTRIQNNHFNNLFYLEFINLSSNTFDVIDSDSFRRLFKLREIHVDDCDRLYRIDSKTFIDNSNLNYVSLSNNHKLKRLPKFLFVNKPNLKHLRISGNDFSTLDASDLPLDNLETLTLGKNPFQCNCSLHWLWVLKERQIYKNCTCGSRTYCYDTCIDNVPKTEKLIKDYYYGKSEEYDGEDLTSSLLSSSPDSDENYEYDNDREKNLRFRSFEKDFLPVILDIDDIYCRGIKSTEKILFKNVAKSNFDCTATWMFILTNNKNFSLTTTTETNIYNEPSFPVNMHKNQKPPHIVYV
ncbi:tartan, putative [Pediculus humanus corporis]|uniref:Tartan, putative n=1 Tax=Pediculus humanus subsp. corporis TaxID=121224 RepID=E0VRX7_PEDHC|nr:tartan, putative [Pediculus humanus corporis]EEB16133.1 tartan, putative [Pediculus humanus corporis]